MSRKFQYVSLDRIIAKLYRDLGLEEISETDIVEWAGEALEGIGAINLYEEVVTFAEVKNHKLDIPCGLYSIIQMARYNESNTDLPTLQTGLVESISTYDPDVFDCSTLLLPTEPTYYSPSFDLKGEYDGWSNSTFYRKFTPIRLSTHTFFKTVGTGTEIYDSFGTDEYNIVQDQIRFSFKEGLIALAYHRTMTDKETGYPLIPDDYAITTAITMYITMKYMGRLWYLGREGYADKFQKAEQDWHWYCKQAGNVLLAPFGEDEFQNILEGRKQMIPRHNKYYGFFGNLGRNQDAGWTRGNLYGGTHITNRR
jgi:hypothetical protein